MNRGPRVSEWVREGWWVKVGIGDGDTRRWRVGGYALRY